MDFSSMSGWDFERYCADCLLKKGFTKAEVTSGSGDHGVDIIAEQNGIRFGIQCKLYQGQIPNKAVQEAYTGASYYDCDVAVIMSNSELTKQAKDEAKKLRVKFWDVADYMPGENKKATETTVITTVVQTIEEHIPQSYEEYVQSQEAIDKELLGKIQLQAESAQNESNEYDLAISNPYAAWDFKQARLWIELADLRLTPIIKSINCYCDEIRRLSLSSTEKRTILLGKLIYIEELCSTLTTTGDRLCKDFSNECYQIKNILLNNLKGSKTIDADDFNQKCWNARYLYGTFLEISPMFEKIAQCFTNEELTQIYNAGNSKWYKEGSVEETAVHDGIGGWHRLAYWWSGFLDFIERERQNIPPYDEDFAVASAIEKYKNAFEKTLQRIVCYDYNDYYFLQLKKKITVKRLEKERLEHQEELARQESESIRRKQKEEIKAQREKSLREQQEKERIAYAQKKEERRKKINSYVERYWTQKKSIQKDLEEAKRNTEETAKRQVQNLEAQIVALEAKKKSFALFRKKRNDNLNQNIKEIEKQKEAILQWHPKELERLEKEAQRKQDAAYRETLCLAEQERLKSEVQAAIKRYSQRNI